MACRRPCWRPGTHPRPLLSLVPRVGTTGSLYTRLRRCPLSRVSRLLRAPASRTSVVHSGPDAWEPWGGPALAASESCRHVCPVYRPVRSGDLNHCHLKSRSHCQTRGEDDRVRTLSPPVPKLRNDGRVLIPAVLGTVVLKNKKGSPFGPVVWGQAPWWGAVTAARQLGWGVWPGSCVPRRDPGARELPVCKWGLRWFSSSQ